MIARVVSITVKPEFYEAFEAVTYQNHRGSVEEPGVVRFDVLRDEKSPGSYTLYEVYANREAVLAHKETEHYKAWRAAVEEMMEKPREGTDFYVLYPTSEK